MSHPILAPSDKDRAYENFPVGSRLIAPSLRRVVHLYYQWARAADDISDHARLTPQEKKKRLTILHDALTNKKIHKDTPAWCHALRAELDARDIPLCHATDLLIAFGKDADNHTYATWDSLIHDYCDYSAAPVGRFLLALHGENEGGFFYSDALCNALQILNHIQDIKEDASALNRIYLPQNWMKELRVTDKDCRKNAMTTNLKRLTFRMLNECETLIDEARRLPFLLKSRRLRMESAAIVTIAERLSAKLRRNDSLAQRVQLSRFTYASCLVRGTLEGI